MNVINESVTNKLEIKKSIFITKLYKIKNVDEVLKYIDMVKRQYENATHYCYAYIIDKKQKSSDDNEPSGTAGTPIMNVLLKNNLNYILCIVIRYFGGIKLGVGGLSRAYSRAVRESIKISNLKVLIDGYRISIITSYDKQKNIDHLLKNCTFEKNYNNNVKYIVDCNNSIINILKDKNIDFQILDKIKIEL